MGVRRVEYLPVSGLVADERNPKLHDELTIRESISRFGVLDPIVRDERTGRIIHGHGRAVVLRLMQEAGDTVPGGVQVAADGVWLVPVVVGWSSKDDAEAGAALVALNRTTELGGWDDDKLFTLLDDLSDLEDGLLGVGYSDADLEGFRGLDDFDPDPSPTPTPPARVAGAEVTCPECGHFFEV